MSEIIITSAEAAREFMLAGKAYFTVVSVETQTRFTFKVVKSKDEQRHYIRVLSGPDNTTNYSYLGTIFGESEYRHGHRSKIQTRAKSALAFRWLWKQLKVNQLPETVEFWHEGYCGRCGRLLTDPDSIARGIGPKCAAIMGR